MTTHSLHTQHDRLFAGNRFVYPVISRRSHGTSVGINLNPDRVCNFDCIYCQVDRTSQSETRFVELDALLEELDQTLSSFTSGALFEVPPFCDTPSDLRRLNDIAFSGDGEPTTHLNFDEVVAACADVKKRHGLNHAKMVLITNASMLHRPHVARGLSILDNNNGEIWAKLDAGTETYYRRIERTPIPFSQVLKNITVAAQARPIVIQSLFMRVEGEPPDSNEIKAFCDRIREIILAGGAIQLVQIYTIARPPAESFVAPLTDEEVDAIVNKVIERTQLPAAAFYGTSE